ncbi:MAG: diguanylate cyclase [Myxococcota bacterium]
MAKHGQSRDELTVERSNRSPWMREGLTSIAWRRRVRLLQRSGLVSPNGGLIRPDEAVTPRSPYRGQGMRGCAFHVVDTGEGTVAVLDPDGEKRFDANERIACLRVLRTHYPVALELALEAPAAAVVRCAYRGTDAPRAAREAAFAAWAMKARGRWKHVPWMTFAIRFEAPTAELGETTTAAAFEALKTAWMSVSAVWRGERAVVSNRTDVCPWNDLLPRLRGRGPLHIVVFDVEAMGAFNALHGRPFGDLLLAHLTNAFHDVAFGEGRSAIRVDGNQFAIFTGDGRRAARVAKRGRDIVKAMAIPRDRASQTSNRIIRVRSAALSVGDPSTFPARVHAALKGDGRERASA